MGAVEDLSIAGFDRQRAQQEPDLAFAREIREQRQCRVRILGKRFGHQDVALHIEAGEIFGQRDQLGTGIDSLVHPIGAFDEVRRRFGAGAVLNTGDRNRISHGFLHFRGAYVRCTNRTPHLPQYNLNWVFTGSARSARPRRSMRLRQ